MMNIRPRSVMVVLAAAAFGLAGCSTASSGQKTGEQQAGPQPTATAQAPQTQPTKPATPEQEVGTAKAGAPQNQQVPPQQEVGTAKAGIAQATYEAMQKLSLPKMAGPFDNDIITSAQPTPAQFSKLADAGVHTVINLRAPGEKGEWDEAAKAKEMGLNYVNIPVSGAKDLTRQKVELFNDVLRKEQFPFLVHCSSSNRVGAMMALRAYWFQGKSAEQALAIGKKAGLTHLEDAVRAKMTK